MAGARGAGGLAPDHLLLLLLLLNVVDVVIVIVTVSIDLKQVLSNS